ncbi:MAG: trypsin-like peptidase domain-containing protein [Desulfobacterales bacterium]
MIMLQITHHGTSDSRLIKYFLPVILGTLITALLVVGCGQQDRKTPIDFINLGRVGDKAIPATVYIEVINRAETVEPLPSFKADPFFQRYFDVDMLNRKFSDELVGRGTGMIIDSEGHVLTNYHVVRGAAAIEVRLANGRWRPAKLIGTDPATDLAVIRVSDHIPLPCVTFGNSNNLTVDEPVATLGYVERIRGIPRPKLTPTVFGGRIRAMQPNGITYCSVCPDFWTTDAGNNTGNSGALLLNRQGEVVGVDVAIVTQSHAAKTLGFAIPSNMAVKIAAQLISNE